VREKERCDPEGVPAMSAVADGCAHHSEHLSFEESLGTRKQMKLGDLPFRPRGGKRQDIPKYSTTMSVE